MNYQIGLRSSMSKLVFLASRETAFRELGAGFASDDRCCFNILLRHEQLDLENVL